jgi:hypothetical protein
MSEADTPTTILGKIGKQVGAEVKTVSEALSTHTGSTSNPHSVTKSQVGLGNVENTQLSTWAGSENITTLGTITTGTIPYANISGTPTLGDISSVTGDFTVGGNLTVNGETTTLNTQTLAVEDNIIEVNLTASDGTATASTAGLQVNRGDGESEEQIDISTTKHPDGFVAPTSNEIDSWTSEAIQSFSWTVNSATSMWGDAYTYTDASDTKWTLSTVYASGAGSSSIYDLNLTPTSGTTFKIGTLDRGTGLIDFIDGWGVDYVDPGTGVWDILITYTPILGYASNTIGWANDVGAMAKTTSTAVIDALEYGGETKKVSARYQAADTQNFTWEVRFVGSTASGDIRLIKGTDYLNDPYQSIGSYEGSDLTIYDGWSIDFVANPSDTEFWDITVDHAPIAADGDKASLIWDENSGQGFWEFGLGTGKADLKAKDITASKVTVDSGDSLILGYDANSNPIPLGTVAAFSASLTTAKA